MFDWDTAFKIAKRVFVTALSITILTWTSSLGEGYLEDIIAKPGYGGMDNLLRAYMWLDGYLAVASLIIAVPSYIFYRIARTRRRMF